MKIAFNVEYGYSNIGVSLYIRVGNNVRYIPKPEKDIEWKEIKPGFVSPEDATFARVERHEILEFYESLKEEMLRVGLLQKDISEKEQVLLKEHLADAIKTRDIALSIAKKSDENTKELLSQNRKLFDELLEPAITTVTNKEKFGDRK